MKRFRFLVGAASFAIAASALFMHAGSASATICTTECGGTTPAVLALQAVLTDGTPKAAQADIVIVKVLDKVTPGL